MLKSHAASKPNPAKAPTKCRIFQPEKSALALKGTLTPTPKKGWLDQIAVGVSPTKNRAQNLAITNALFILYI